MKRVMEVLDTRTAELASAPFFEFLRDETIEPRKRLAFAPCAAHFVMTFADLYSLVLREEPARDPYQELVNAHTREDENHWQWFLKDLEKLGQNPKLSFAETLRFVWSEETVQMRMLSYHMCRLGLGADSIKKLVLVHAIEAAGKVTVSRVSEVGREFGVATGEKLVYLGPHHSDTESEHTLEEDSVHRAIAEIELAPETARELVTVVDDSFRYFRSFIDEMHAFATRERSVGAS